MKFKVVVALLFSFLLVFQSVSFSPVYAEKTETKQEEMKQKETKKVERKSQKRDESSYELMSYADDAWYDLAGKTGSATATAIKNFFWMINVVLSNIVLVIVYNLFSLDIIDMTKDVLSKITSSTAGALLSDFGTFAIALAALGIVIRAYVQENWRAFFKLLTVLLVSLTLLFSIKSEKFNYIDLAHNLSTSLENTIMKVNPTLSSDNAFNYGEINDNNKGSIVKNISTSVENKVFDALIYKPYLLLQYGTTNEKEITKEDSKRITAYLDADPKTEDGADKRKEITEKEYNEYDNKNIFAGNGFKQAGYILVMMISTITQGVVFFFIALIRILLQFGFIMMLLIAPIILFMSLFPSFEALVGRYTKNLSILIVFKAVTMFFILVGTSFISLGYDMTDTSNNLYYRIFIQIIFCVVIIFIYTKRQFALGMLQGAGLSLGDVGAANTGRNLVRGTKQGIRGVRDGGRQAKQTGKQVIGGLKKAKNVAGEGASLARGAYEGIKGKAAVAQMHAFTKGKEKVGDEAFSANESIKQDEIAKVSGERFSPSGTTSESMEYGNSEVAAAQESNEEATVVPTSLNDSGANSVEGSDLRRSNVVDLNGRSIPKPSQQEGTKQNPTNNKPITPWEAQKQIASRKGEAMPTIPEWYSRSGSNISSNIPTASNMADSIASTVKPVQSMPKESARVNPTPGMPKESARVKPASNMPKESARVKPVSSMPKETARVNPTPNMPKETARVNPTPSMPKETARVNPTPSMPKETARVNPAPSMPRESIKVNPVQNTPNVAPTVNTPKNTPVLPLRQNPVQNIPVVAPPTRSVQNIVPVTPRVQTTTTPSPTTFTQTRAGSEYRPLSSYVTKDFQAPVIKTTPISVSAPVITQSTGGQEEQRVKGVSVTQSSASTPKRAAASKKEETPSVNVPKERPVKKEPKEPKVDKNSKIGNRNRVK